MTARQDDLPPVSKLSKAEVFHICWSNRSGSRPEAHLAICTGWDAMPSCLLLSVLSWPGLARPSHVPGTTSRHRSLKMKAMQLLRDSGYVLE